MARVSGKGDLMASHTTSGRSCPRRTKTCGRRWRCKQRTTRSTQSSPLRSCNERPSHQQLSPAKWTYNNYSKLVATSHPNTTHKAAQTAGEDSCSHCDSANVTGEITSKSPLTPVTCLMSLVGRGSEISGKPRILVPLGCIRGGGDETG